MEITQDNKKLILGAGIAIGAYFLVLKPILQKIGILKTKEEIQKEISDQTNVSEAEKNVLNKGLKLTKSKTEWDQIADSIYNSLYSYLDNKFDKDNAIYNLARLKNDADAIYLVQTFGKRKEKFWNFDYGEGLPLIPFVNANLIRKDIDLINDNYKRKGMNFKL
jgi:hypothetical protein